MNQIYGSYLRNDYLKIFCHATRNIFSWQMLAISAEYTNKAI